MPKKASTCDCVEKLTEILKDSGFDSTKYGDWSQFHIHDLIEAARQDRPSSVWIHLGIIEGSYHKQLQEINELKARLVALQDTVDGALT